MLKLEDVSKKYRQNGGLKSVNLTIEEGNLYLFVGKNGSGKSTTIKLISKVIFNHQNQGTMKNEFKHIIYLPDKRTYPKLLKTSTFLVYYLNHSKSQEKINQFLQRYQIPNQAIGTLSKGMLQKLGILQAILSDGDLYLLDEPTDGLDTNSIKLFKEDLLQLKNQKKTIVISTHNRLLFKDLQPITYLFKEGICHEKK